MKLALSGIGIALSGKQILHDVTLSVQNGAFVSLLGPSGCGKSTLLKIIAGILPQDTGTVAIGGEIADGLPPHKRGTTIVFQDTRLFLHMSAAENVGFPMRMQGIKRAEYLREAEALLERVQLGGLGRRRPQQLSGGQQQRVALARALAAKPAVLLLDEPFSGLDESLRDEMRQLVVSLHRSFGMTTVLVTHDSAEALSLSDTVILMHEGRILQAGTPRELFERPRSRAVASYFGEATYLTGSISNGIFHSEGFTFCTDAPEGCCTAVLRPHAFCVTPGGAFRLVRSVYRGTEIAALFCHEPTGLTVSASLPADCGLYDGALATLTVRPNAAAFLME